MDSASCRLSDSYKFEMTPGHFKNLCVSVLVMLKMQLSNPDILSDRLARRNIKLLTVAKQYSQAQF
jgi:hypothetical protein